VSTFEKLVLLNIQPYYFEFRHNFDQLFFFGLSIRKFVVKTKKIWEWGRTTPSSVKSVKQRRDYRPACNFVLCVCIVHDKSCVQVLEDTIHETLNKEMRDYSTGQRATSLTPSVVQSTSACNTLHNFVLCVCTVYDKSCGWPFNLNNRVEWHNEPPPLSSVLV